MLQDIKMNYENAGRIVMTHDEAGTSLILTAFQGYE